MCNRQVSSSELSHNTDDCSDDISVAPGWHGDHPCASLIENIGSNVARPITPARILSSRSHRTSSLPRQERQSVQQNSGRVGWPPLGGNTSCLLCSWRAKSTGRLYEHGTASAS